MLSPVPTVSLYSDAAVRYRPTLPFPSSPSVVNCSVLLLVIFDCLVSASGVFGLWLSWLPSIFVANCPFLFAFFLLSTRSVLVQKVLLGAFAVRGTWRKCASSILCDWSHDMLSDGADIGSDKALRLWQTEEPKSPALVCPVFCPGIHPANNGSFLQRRPTSTLFGQVPRQSRGIALPPSLREMHP